MSPQAHLAQAVLGTAVLYPAIGEKALIFGASVMAIDVDHFIEYYLDTGRLDIKGMFEYHDILFNNPDNFLGINYFHTIECYLTLFLAGLYIPEANLVLMGFLFHHLFDQIQLMQLKRPFARVFSIPEYFYRRKKHITSITDIMKNNKTIKFQLANIT